MPTRICAWRPSGRCAVSRIGFPCKLTNPFLNEREVLAPRFARASADDVVLVGDESDGATPRTGRSRGPLAAARRVDGESLSSTRGGGVVRLLRRAAQGAGNRSSQPAPATAAVCDAFICYSRRDRAF